MRIREFRPSREEKHDPASPLRAAAVAARAAAANAERAERAEAQRGTVRSKDAALTGVARAGALRALGGAATAEDAASLYAGSKRGLFRTAGDRAARGVALETAVDVVRRGGAAAEGIAAIGLAVGALAVDEDGDCEETEAFCRVHAVLVVKAGLGADDAAVRAAAIDALPAVIARCADGDGDVAVTSLRLLATTLGDLRSPDRPAVASTKVARAAATAAARVAAGATRSAAAARAEAVAFVETTRCWTAEAQGAVLAALASEDASVRLAAANACADAPYKLKIAEALIPVGQTDDDAAVRDAANYAHAAQFLAGEEKARRNAKPAAPRKAPLFAPPGATLPPPLAAASPPKAKRRPDRGDSPPRFGGDSPPRDVDSPPRGEYEY